MDPRMSDHAANIEWLSNHLKTITDRDFIVQLMPEQRASGFDLFGMGRDQEALYRVTLKGIDSTPCFCVARIALRDEEHVAGRISAVLPKPDPEATEEKESEPN